MPHQHWKGGSCSFPLRTWFLANWTNMVRETSVPYRLAPFHRALAILSEDNGNYFNQRMVLCTRHGYKKIVIIDGATGIGKTSLASKVIRELSCIYERRTWIILCCPREEDFHQDLSSTLQKKLHQKRGRPNFQTKENSLESLQQKNKRLNIMFALIDNGTHAKSRIARQQRGCWGQVWVARGAFWF